MPVELETTPDFREVRLLAAPAGATLTADLAGLRALAGEPFAAERIARLGQLSQRILRHPALRQDAASVAVAFWLRPANVARILAAWREGVRAGIEIVPAGLVFHVAPANVDTMFLYSWALAYVAGNANVVRLSTERNATVEGLLECIGAEMTVDPVAWSGNLFLTYPHSEAVTAAFSAVCDQRVVWGGDETVRRLRQIPLSTHAGERSFASKFSFSVVSAERFLAALPAARAELVQRMLTDLAPFAQQACSSPHLLYWLGADESAHMAQDAFMATVAAQPAAIEVGTAVQRAVAVFEAAADGAAWERGALHASLWNLRVASGGHVHSGIGFGVVQHAVLPHLAALASLCSPADQTVGHWGLDSEEVRSLARICGRSGVDRVVPIGRALEFGPVWDGYDLLGDFVRLVWTVE